MISILGSSAGDERVGSAYFRSLRLDLAWRIKKSVGLKTEAKLLEIVWTYRHGQEIRELYPW